MRPQRIEQTELYLANFILRQSYRLGTNGFDQTDKQTHCKTTPNPEDMHHGYLIYPLRSLGAKPS